MRGISTDVKTGEVTSFDVSPITASERASELMAMRRVERDQLLTSTDSWALSDRVMTAPMATYRQALRDWPANNKTVAKLENPVWPTKP